MRRGGVVGVLAAVIALAGAVTPAFARGTTAPSSTYGGSAAAGAGGPRVFSRPPVLVRAGEDVRIPVDASCSTSQGTACDASVSFSIQELGLPWREYTAPAGPDLTFDVSAPAERAADAGASSGSVAYVIRVTDRLGRTESVPAAGQAAPLRFYVVRDMPTLGIPAPRFGHVATGTTVLSLPWGTGSRKAGLAPGNESATLGPSSFDVDADGRVYLLDGLQRRLAVFSGDRLVRSTPIDAGAWADVAVARDGSAYVLAAGHGEMSVRRVGADGHTGPATSLGPGIPTEIGVAADQAFVRSLPLDAWVAVPGADGAPGTVSMGRPLGEGGQLLKVIDVDSLRLATVRGGVATHAVELASSVNLGEVALAAPDGRGGYVAVVHVWRGTITPADQYQVIHVSADGTVTAFSTRHAEYAQTAALSKFRLGRDGALYQLTSGPAGVRIVRYRIGGIA
jgi:hypothetical protein